MAASISGESVLGTSGPDVTLIRAGENGGAISLTIGIPTYRRPSLVVRAIRSAIASSEAFAGSVELIVSDNSPEVTSAICQSELSQWTGRAVYLANRPSIGMVPNLNQCIARARGRYVVLLHDDDYLLPGATRAVLAETEAASSSAAVLLFGVRVVDGEGRVRRQQVFTREQDLSPPEAVVRVLSDPSFIRAPGIVIRRDVFSALGMFDHALGNPNDFEMWLRIASRFGIRCLPATISAYSVHEAAVTTRTFTVETVRTNLEIFDRQRRCRSFRSHSSGCARPTGSANSSSPASAGGWVRKIAKEHAPSWRCSIFRKSAHSNFLRSAASPGPPPMCSSRCHRGSRV